MPNLQRERFTVDVAVEMPDGLELSRRQRNEIAAKISALTHTLALDGVDGVKIVHPDTKVVYGHNHVSTSDYRCQHCVQQSGDEHNNDTIN